MNLLAFPTKQLFPYDEVLDYLEPKIKELILKKEGGYFFALRGDKGCGKTSFLHNLRKSLKAKGIETTYFSWDKIKVSIEPFIFINENTSLEAENFFHTFLPCVYTRREQKHYFSVEDFLSEEIFLREISFLDYQSFQFLYYFKKYIYKDQLPVVLIDNLDELSEKEKNLIKILVEDKSFSFIFIVTSSNLSFDFLSSSKCEVISFTKLPPIWVQSLFVDPDTGEFLYKALGSNLSVLFYFLRHYFLKDKIVFEKGKFIINVSEEEVRNFSLKKALEEDLLLLSEEEIEVLRKILFLKDPFSAEDVKTMGIDVENITSILAKAPYLVKRGERYAFFSDSLKKDVLELLGGEILYKKFVDTFKQKISTKKIIESFPLLNFFLYFYCKAHDKKNILTYVVYLLRLSVERKFYSKILFLEDIFLEASENVNKTRRINYSIGRGYYYLARAYHSIGENEKTRFYLARAYSLIKSYGNKKMEFLIFSQLVKFYLRQRNFKKANYFVEKAREIALFYEDKEMLISIFNLYGELKYYSKNYEEAKKIFSLILDDYAQLVKRRKLKTEYNKALRGLGKIFSTQGDYFQAIEYYEKSLIYAFESQDPVDKVDTYQRLAIASMKLGRLEKAGIYLAYAMMELASCGELFLTNKVFSTLASFYMYKGDFEKLEKLLSISLKLSRKIKNEFGILIAYQNYFHFYFLQGDKEKAMKFLDKGKRIISKNGFSSAYLELLEGKFYLYLQDFPKCRNILKPLLEKKALPREVYILSRTYLLVNSFFHKDEELLDQLFRELKDEFSGIQDVYLLGWVYVAIGYYELWKENFDYARVLLKKSEDLLLPFYKGVDVLRMYCDLLELGYFPEEKAELLKQARSIYSDLGDDNILFLRGLKLNII